MTTVHAHLDEPREQAATTLRKAAGDQGWNLAEGASDTDTLVFRKGMTLFSWGAEITVQLDETADNETGLTFTTKETWAFTDWGRGRRAIGKLLDAAGAEKD
ncbi:MAG: hypothetical protein ACRDQD_29970 [Nocardioidaceae bacterium]